MFGFGYTPSPGIVAASKAKQAAEKAIEEFGWGECNACRGKIVRNKTLNSWETELLLDYCPETGDHKHKPRVDLEEP